MSIPFLLDPNSEGGLGMTTEQIGFTQGTVGIIGLTLGGILGGMAVARHGLKQWLWYMVWAISLPDLVYVFLSYFRNKPAVDQCLHFYRTVWLWIWVHGIHAVSHLFFPGKSQYGTLRHLYSIYGTGHDASRHDSRMDAGASGISALLPLDHGMLCRNFRRNCPTENRS